MKKLGKIIFGTLSAAALAAGAYYIYKNFIKHDTTDDFDEFDDDFDDLDDSDTDDNSDEKNGREYVSIQMDHESSGKNAETSGENPSETE